MVCIHTARKRSAGKPVAPDVRMQRLHKPPNRALMQEGTAYIVSKSVDLTVSDLRGATLKACVASFKFPQLSTVRSSAPSANLHAGKRW